MKKTKGTMLRLLGAECPNCGNRDPKEIGHIVEAKPLRAICFKCEFVEEAT